MRRRIGRNLLLLLWGADTFGPFKGIDTPKVPMSGRNAVQVFDRKPPEWLPPPSAASAEDRSHASRLTAVRRALDTLIVRGWMVKEQGTHLHRPCLVFSITGEGRQALAKYKAQYQDRLTRQERKTGLYWVGAKGPDGRRRWYCPAMQAYRWQGVVEKAAKADGGWRFKLTRPDGLESAWITARRQSLLGAKAEAEATWRAQLARKHEETS